MAVYKDHRVSIQRALDFIGKNPAVQSPLDELKLALKRGDVRWWESDDNGGEVEIPSERSARLRQLVPKEDIAFFSYPVGDLDAVLNRRGQGAADILIDFQGVERIWGLATVSRTEKATPPTSPEGGSTKPSDPARELKFEQFSRVAIRELKKNPLLSERKLAEAIEKANIGVKFDTARNILQGRHAAACEFGGLQISELRARAKTELASEAKTRAKVRETARKMG